MRYNTPPIRKTTTRPMDSGFFVSKNITCSIALRNQKSDIDPRRNLPRSVFRRLDE
jgi:hypothetical protein